MFNTQTPKPVSRQGGAAASKTAQLELTLLVLSNLFSDSFYESKNELVTRFANLAKKVEPEYLQKLAVYSREVMNIRTASTALVGLYALDHGKPSAQTIEKVFVRGDEVLEFIATVKALSSKGTLTKAAKQTAQDVLQNLNEHSVLRYMGGTKSWKLVDVLRLTHPSPKDVRQKALFSYLAHAGKLGSQTKAWDALTNYDKALLPVIGQSFTNPEAISWERARSESGTEWPELLDGMGYMALLRNLRNFLQEQPYSNTVFWDKVIARLQSREEVAKSKQLFYRFYSAIKAVENCEIWQLGGRSQELLVALNRAFEYSLENIPTIRGKTLVIVDTSGSMNQPVSDKSGILVSEIACLFGAAAQTAFAADLVTFATNATKQPRNLAKSTLGIAQGLIANSNGGGTNLSQVERVARLSDYDNLIILSDMQLAESQHLLGGFASFQGNIFSFDLAGYKPGFFLSSKPNCYAIGGFSDASLRLISEISEGGIESLEQRINSVQI